MTTAPPSRIDGPTLQHEAEMVWIGDMPRRGAEQCPDRIAIDFVDAGQTVTYRQLDQRSDAFAAWLTAQGYVPGDRVGYLGKNSDAYLPALFGAIRAGVILVPLNWRLAAPEIGYQIADSGCRLVICDADLRPLLEGVSPSVSVLPTEGDASLRAVCALEAAPAPLPRDREQIALMLYTSGTTGNPKGVMVSHYALSIARHSDAQIPCLATLKSGEISLSAMPNFHIGGMSWVLMCIARQQTVILTADPMPANMIKLFRDTGARHSFIVPTVLRGMVDTLKASGEPAPRLGTIQYGAMPMSESLLKECMAMFGCDFVQYFGMTENTGSVTYLGTDDHDPARPHLLKSVGKPYPGMAVEIRGPDGTVLPRGAHGEIWVHSPSRLSGYWNLPEKSREALVDGWYASGDGGYLDDEGFLFLTDRIKDMIVSGGENVYPVEVEEAVRQHPAVLDAAVVGLPDDKWGEAVTAVVELRPEQTVTAAELISFLKGRIAAFKTPKQVHVVTALPRTASGKVRRAELRGQFQPE